MVIFLAIFHFQHGDNSLAPQRQKIENGGELPRECLGETCNENTLDLIDESSFLVAKVEERNEENKSEAAEVGEGIPGPGAETEARCSQSNVDGGQRARILNDLMAKLQRVEGNSVAYVLQIKDEQFFAKCISCDKLISLGDSTKRIYNLVTHTKAQRHRLNLAFIQPNRNGVDQSLAGEIDKRHPGVFKVKGMTASCTICKNSEIKRNLGQRNFMANLQQHVTSSKHQEKVQVNKAAMERMSSIKNFFLPSLPTKDSINKAKAI